MRSVNSYDSVIKRQNVATCSYDHSDNDAVLFMTDVVRRSGTCVQLFRRLKIMKIIIKCILLICIFCIISSYFVSCEEEKGTNMKKKLQIGVKKRVENCQVKSKKGDFLHMHYKGTLEDGTEFDSSYGRGQPLTFTLGSGQVIKGWDQGLMGMCEGEKRKLVIPSELGYGASGAPPKIPGGATLIFEVELIKIERRDEL